MTVEYAIVQSSSSRAIRRTYSDCSSASRSRRAAYSSGSRVKSNTVRQSSYSRICRGRISRCSRNQESCNLNSDEPINGVARVVRKRRRFDIRQLCREIKGPVRPTLPSWWRGFVIVPSAGSAVGVPVMEPSRWRVGRVSVIPAGSVAYAGIRGGRSRRRLRGIVTWRNGGVLGPVLIVTGIVSKRRCFRGEQRLRFKRHIPDIKVCPAGGGIKAGPHVCTVVSANGKRRSGVVPHSQNVTRSMDQKQCLGLTKVLPGRRHCIKPDPKLHRRLVER